MASLPMALGQAPPVPPEVSGQMGAGPGPMGMGSIASRQPGMAPGSESPNPHGSLFAQANAVQAVLEQMAGAEPVFAPFARAAMSAISNGVSAVSAAPAPQALPQGLAGEPPGIPGGNAGVPLG
jgi:hypothetical protein